MGFSKSNEAEQQWLTPERAAAPIWPWLALIAVLAIVFVMRWQFIGDSGGGNDGHDHAAVGSKLTVLELQPLTGEARPISLDDLQGKVTLINFWGPWCGPCAIEFPHLMEVEQHFRSHPDFLFLSVSSNPDARDERGLAESTLEFLKQQQATIPTFRDPDGKSTIALIQSAKFEGFGYPTTLVLDRAGTIRGVWIGYRPGDERGVRRTIEQLLRTSADSQATSPPKQAG